MTTRLQHLCDHPTPEEHVATTDATAKIGDTTFHMDTCDDHRMELIKILVEHGFTPTGTRIGKDNRGSYISDSGEVFTSSDVRAWLSEQGVAAPERGRLALEHLNAYAKAH